MPLWKQTANEEREKRENGDPLYANALKAGTVDPKAPKLSYDDVKSIIAAVKDEIPDDGGCTPVYQGKAIVERIRNIQRCPDLYYGCYNSHTRYVYWPDADTVEERRTCIDVCDYESLTGCRIVYYVYNDNGDIVTEEVLYNTML